MAGELLRGHPNYKGYESLSPIEQLYHRVNEYPDLSKYAEEEIREGATVTLMGLRAPQMQGLEILRVDVEDVVKEVMGFALPRMVFGGRSIETLKPMDTVFMADGYPGRDFPAFFFVIDQKVGLALNRGLAVPSPEFIKEYGVSCYTPPERRMPESRHWSLN
jgi:hypothetical protein